MAQFCFIFISQKETTLKFINRWLVVFFTGIFTAVMAAVVHIVVEKISHAKFSLIQNCILLLQTVLVGKILLY